MKINSLANVVIPVHAGIQRKQLFWMPAFAGMTDSWKMVPSEDNQDRINLNLGRRDCFTPLRFVRNDSGCGWSTRAAMLAALLAAYLSGREK